VDPSVDEIRLLSVVTDFTEGVSSHPRENTDFICCHRVRWEVEYVAPGSAQLDCPVREGNRAGEKLASDRMDYEVDLTITWQ
jgi:hypothetical protein